MRYGFHPKTEIKKGQHLSSKTEFKKGNKHTEEWKRKMSERMKGNKYALGFQHSEETRKKMSQSRIGEKHWNWKGKTIKYSGYVLIHQSKHPFASKSGYVPEHRLVAEKYLKRYLLPTERIHHINEKKTDNRIENLYLFSFCSHHTAYHQLLKNNPQLINRITKSNLIDYQEKPVK